MYWNDLNSRLKAEYGCKVYKLALSSGCSCPNRDGTLDTRGCIFCDGAGAFAEAGAIPDQLAAARLRVAAKAGTDAKYIAYFQSFTNTYGDADRLRASYQAAMAPEDVVILSIATRPDCLGPEVLELLYELNQRKPVWVELGLQTMHEETAGFIRRGYPLSVFDEAMENLQAIGVETVVHAILGLPGETPEMILDTVRYINASGADGIKLQLLHILKGTDLASYYETTGFHVLTLEEYVDLVIHCLEIARPDLVIHRLTGDGPKDLLIAPLWSQAKRQVLNTIQKELKIRDTYQGRLYTPVPGQIS